MSGLTFEPIGVFRSSGRFPYEARRQGTVDASGEVGVIELARAKGFEQALHDLEGFERIWLVYAFHANPNWKPKVVPPRGPRIKRGVFATRAPYRPNPIGLSCVKLVDVQGLRIFVEEFDLLDGTPILDIKPYLPYADAFPNARTGWLEEIESRSFQVEFSPEAEQRLQWLEANGVQHLRGFLTAQLEFEPTDKNRKRIVELRTSDLGSEPESRLMQLSYRTWRADFQVARGERKLTVLTIYSGYSATERDSDDDPYNDKNVHRKFVAAFEGIVPTENKYVETLN